MSPVIVFCYDGWNGVTPLTEYGFSRAAIRRRQIHVTLEVGRPFGAPLYRTPWKKAR